MYITGIFWVILLILEDSSCSNTHSVSACYGITFDNFMSLSCEAGSVIALKEIRAMVKPKSTMCPQEDTEVSPAEKSCCRQEKEDCGSTYTGIVASQYYKLCHGRRKCQMLQPTWVDTALSTSCDTNIYLDRTNYMVMEYKCISTSSSFSPCSLVSVTDEVVHLWNNNYPSGINPDENGCFCSVEASCDTTIQISTLDIRFAQDAGMCQQSIALIEDNQTLGCGVNNNYTVKTVYTSSSPHFTIETHNTLSTVDGRFWFEITTSEKHANLTVSCGKLLRPEIRVTEKQSCDSTATLSVTIPLSSNTTSGILTTLVISTKETTVNSGVTKHLTTINLTTLKMTLSLNDTSESENSSKTTMSTAITSATNGSDNIAVSETKPATVKPSYVTSDNGTLMVTYTTDDYFTKAPNNRNTTASSLLYHNETGFTVSTENYTLRTPFNVLNYSSTEDTSYESANYTETTVEQSKSTTEITDISLFSPTAVREPGCDWRSE